MSLTTKRQLPNVNHQKNRLIHTTENAQQTIKLTGSSPEKVHSQHRNHAQTPKQDSIITDEIQLQFDRRLQEIKRKLTTSIFTDESIAQSNKSKSDLQLHSPSKLKTQSSAIRESTKNIRENLNIHLKNEFTKEQDSNFILHRRRRPEPDQRQIENEYLIQQKTLLSKSTALNEMLNFKKELEKSEQKRQDLIDQLESIKKMSDEKDKLLSKTQINLKEMTENCDTFERQNLKLQQDLSLTLEKLEEMTDEAERFAQESLVSQKQLADSEQKREEFQIQTQETNKQSNARIKKLEKDLERAKDDSTQLLEKNQQLNNEIDRLKEQINKLETNLTELNTNSKELEKEFHQCENNNIQLRSINSSQEVEINTLKQTVIQLENQFTFQRQHLSQIEREKLNLKDETNQLLSKFQQSEHDLQSLTTSCSQLQQEKNNLLQKFKDIQIERDSLIQETNRYHSIQNQYEDIQQRLEITKSDYTRGMKALQIDYETKIETIQFELSEEKNQNSIFQRHEIEYKKEIERLIENISKYEDENNQQKSSIENLSRNFNEKIQLIEDLELKLSRLTIELTTEKAQNHKKDQNYQICLENIYKDIIHCTECLSTDSNRPFIIECPTTSRDQIEIWSNKFKGHLTWLKQELELHLQQEYKLREDLNNSLIDCETDRKYFAAELAKRELIIDQLTNYPKFESIYQFNQDKDDRYEQFQIMIDSVKRDLHTAKAQLL